MALKKPFIDNPESFILDQQRFFKGLQQQSKNISDSPKNRDLRRVIEHFNGSIWFKIHAPSGPFMLKLYKGNLLEELKIVDEQPSDFAIDPAHTDKDRLCIIRLSYPNVL